MKITIENYRGFDIEFDTDSEKFQCIVTEENTKESKSFSSVKKFIDEYKRSNQNFKPFYVISNPKSRVFNNIKRAKVVGIRKDNRFIIENKDGVKKQLSDYMLESCILEIEEDKKHIEQLKELDLELKDISKKYKERENDIINNIKGITLKEFKDNLID